MKIFFLTAAVFYGIVAFAQPGVTNTNAVQDEGRAPYRTRFMSYDIRKEADAGVREGSKYFVPLRFTPVAGTDGAVFEATADIPVLWLDRYLYIRDEGRTGRYLLRVNGRPAGLNTSSYDTNDYEITHYLREGKNVFTVEFDGDIPGGDMERFRREGAPKSLHIWSQPKVHIFDYMVSGDLDPEIGDAFIDLAIVLANGYNTDEQVTIGYDVYDPRGVLKEYTFVEATVRGRGADTVRLRNKIFGTEKYFYSADNPALYKVVLSLRYGGRTVEYIPFRMGFGTTAFDGGNIIRNGKPVAISAVEGDFPVRAGTVEQLRKLKKQGVNTLCLTRPQQPWFYDMAGQEGMYLFDCAAVQCDPRDGDRGPDGTVANKPAYLDRFIDRQQNMFYAGRNSQNIIGWSIGAESGNGYNMYKSYQWLKSADPTRAVVYRFAEGEWNTDTITNIGITGEH